MEQFGKDRLNGAVGAVSKEPVEYRTEESTQCC